MAFQLVDDLLDVYAEPKTFGKELGGDIQENKKTFPYLLALQNANPTQREQLLRYFSSNYYDKNEKYNAVKAIFDELCCKKETEKKVDEFLQKAYQNIDETTLSSQGQDKLRKLALNLSRRKK